MATVTKLSVKPSWFNHNMTRICSFTEIFPDFEVPNNKIMVWNNRDVRGTTKNPSYKGWNYVDSGAEDMGLPRKPGSKTVDYIYDQAFDQVANANGHSGGPVGAAVAAHWDTASNDQTASDIADKYMHLFGSAKDMTIINGEFERQSSNKTNFRRVIGAIGSKLGTMYPNKIFGYWTHGYYTTQPFFLFKTDQQWRDDYNGATGTDGIWSGWQISQMFGYAADKKDAAEDFWTHLQTGEAGRTVDTGNPKRYFITTFWDQQEIVENGATFLHRDVPGKGVVVNKERAGHSACHLFNAALLHTTVLNGIDMWGEPFNIGKDKSTYDNTSDFNDFNHGPNLTIYPNRNYIQQNWFHLGMYFSSLPEAKSIIELSDEWLLPDYKFGSTTVSGNNKYPSFARHNRYPIVRLKYNADKSKALIYAVNQLAVDPLGTTTINVFDNATGLSVDVTVKGTWADLFLVEDIGGGGGGTNVNPVWSGALVHQCNGNFSQVLLEVSGNDGHTVEYTTDGGNTWTPANQSTQGQINNALLVDLPASGQCEPVAFRIPTANNVGDTGCTTTLTNCGSPSVVPCGETEANPHLNANGTHHGYYDIGTNTIVGTFASGQGEFNVYGTWKPTIYLGMGTDGLRYVGYKEPYNGTSNHVYTRTKAGCTEFQDARTTEINTLASDYKVNLDLSPGHSGNTIDFPSFNCADFFGNSSGAQFIYAFTIYKAIPGLQWRINNGSWQNSAVVGNTTQLQNIGASSLPAKDVILTLRVGSDEEKFILRRWTNGGHFTTTTTLTRLRDGVTFVGVFIGDVNLPSYLKFQNTNVVNSASGNGLGFRLNSLNSDQVVKFGFQETGLDWLDIKLLNKNN